jgi:hypothetical protein
MIETITFHLVTYSSLHSPHQCLISKIWINVFMLMTNNKKSQLDLFKDFFVINIDKKQTNADSYYPSQSYPFETIIF